MESTEVISIIGAVGGLCTLIGGLFWKWLMNDQKVSREAAKLAREAATNEREMMSKMFNESIKILSEATERNTLAQERTADEAKQRNGHLAELQLENAKYNKESHNVILKELNCITSQKVKKQTVDEQVIHHSTEE